MEGLLGSVDLWQFVQETSINSDDKIRGVVALLLITLALDENILSDILHEFGEVHNAKLFWDIFETKYNMQWGETTDKDGVFLVENIQKDAEIAERKVVEVSIITDEMKKAFLK